MAQPGELYGRPWSEREYVVVLDAYFATKGQPRHESSRFIQDLARLLGRTPASIYMRMENFASIDPTELSHRRGLAKIGPIGAKVFNDWSNKRDHLSSCADVFHREIEGQQSSQRSFFEPPHVALPRAFNNYELLDPIGQGGFGHVYSCIHVETREIGAIKIIHAEKVHDPEMLHRFVREIRALRAINHPNVIHLLEDNLEHERRFPAFVMELAESNLNDHISSRWTDHAVPPVLDATEATKIIQAMASALTALHSHSPRIIHRDLNPNNILLMSDGRWVLADFGLAKFLDATGSTTSFRTLTRHGGWGAGYYTAPEQYRDFKRTDERADVYALGVLLWELFTSVGPPLDRQNTGLPTELNAIFLKATDRSLQNRYSQVAELSDAFSGVL